QNEHRTDRGATLFQVLQEIIIRKTNATHTLNALNDHSSNIVSKRRIKSLAVIHRNERHSMTRVERRHDLCVVGCCDCAGCTTVKRSFKGYNLFPAREK